MKSPYGRGFNFLMAFRAGAFMWVTLSVAFITPAGESMRHRWCGRVLVPLSLRAYFYYRHKNANAHSQSCIAPACDTPVTAYNCQRRKRPYLQR